jgi:hypothetical protein
MAANVQNNGEDVQYGENVTLRDIMNDDDGNPYRFLALKWREIYGNESQVILGVEDGFILYLTMEQWILEQIRNEETH